MRNRSRLFKPFVAASVQLRLPLSYRQDLILKRGMGTHRMVSKATVVVLAKGKKKRGARI